MSLRDELLRRFPALRGLAARVKPLYVVGGAVRDLLRGSDPADIDLASLDPLVAARFLGRKIIPLGRERFTAYRVSDGAHVYDFAELLDGAIEPDQARRDFTVNAMAVDLADGALLDPYGGRADLARRLVRMVRPSNFDDDPLRLLKGVRMAVTLGFELEARTLQEIAARARLIESVPVERVTYELALILSAGALRTAVALLRATALDRPLGLATPAIHADDVPLAAALAILVDDPRAYGKRWRWSEALIRDVTVLAQLRRRHDRLALFHAGEEIARQLPSLLRAAGEVSLIDWPDFSIVPLLNGDEISAACGLPAGPELGSLKRELVEAQVLERVTTREEAVAFVRARLEV